MSPQETIISAEKSRIEIERHIEQREAHISETLERNAEVRDEAMGRRR